MTKIFIGFLFAFLDFNLLLNGHVLNLLPDFVGTILMLLGTQELSVESERYSPLRPWLLGISAYSALTWVLYLLGRMGNILATLLDIVSTCVMLYITYQIIMGFQDMERRHTVDLRATQAIAMWKINAVLQVAALVLGWIPVINVLLLIAMLVVVILLLVALNTTRKLYAENVTTVGTGKGPEL